MSRLPCGCSPRPPPCSCSSSSSTVTAAGRPSPSDGCEKESPTLSVKMKCDFNGNHVRSGLKVVKSVDSGRLSSYTPTYLEGSCEDFIKDNERSITSYNVCYTKLLRVCKVSTTWKKILEDDKGAFQLYSKAVQKVTKNIKFSTHSTTREYVMFRTALASVQKSAAQIPPKKDAQTKLSSQDDQEDSAYSRHNEFSEVAKTLKKNESLKACIRCNSPAKYDCYLQRATCNREGCGFDYCTRCLCNYHTTKDCSSGRPLKASCKMGPLPGTKKSKKNLRRL
ncbi:PREDICTED: F-box only protein 5 [Galeopterus variegatus]|uniref:F-box only protein 5 n=1 Tax=Galeopterus variegatus TaxID=482537 RepID=A0ABM0RTF1_GALVR|nr:PREDICTED: F-box only protein 5 [Galeopterus variegatus]